MTGTRPRQPSRMRIEHGPFLVCHLLLVAVAIMWFPLGCRDSNGVSEVLPALRPVLQVTSSGTVASADNGDRRLTQAAIVVPAVLAGVLVLAPRGSTRRPAPEDHALPRRLVAAGLRSRAPPLAA